MSKKIHFHLPGRQKLSANDFSVDMIHIEIAEKNILAGQLSKSNEEPLKLEFNISTGKMRLADGYHRYLEKRGGSLESALLQSRNGEFPDYWVDVNLVKNEYVKPFGNREVKLSDAEVKNYMSLFLSKKSRLKRAESLGFDTSVTWYHGTTPEFGKDQSDIEAFSKEKIGEKFNQDEEGFFFINSPQLASDYACCDSLGLSVNGGAVYPVYLRMNNPLVIDDKWCEDNGFPLLSDEGVFSFWDNNYNSILKLKKEHDSIIISDLSANTKMPVVFEPNQIRSIHASFLPEHDKLDFLLGHSFRYGEKPVIKREIEVPSAVVSYISDIQSIIGNRNLSMVNKIFSFLDMIDGGRDAAKKEEKMLLFDEMNQSSFLRMDESDQAKTIATILYGINPTSFEKKVAQGNVNQPKVQSQKISLR